MAGKKNYIYAFYEPVKVDDNGRSEPDAQYYKCWHGSRKTFKLTKAMRYSLTSTFTILSLLHGLPDTYYLSTIVRYDRTLIIQVSSYV